MDAIRKYDCNGFVFVATKKFCIYRDGTKLKTNGKNNPCIGIELETSKTNQSAQATRSTTDWCYVAVVYFFSIHTVAQNIKKNS